MWAQWEQDSSWLDSLLSDTETSIPKMHLEQDSEGELSNRLSVYQVTYLHAHVPPASTLFHDIKLYLYSTLHVKTRIINSCKIIGITEKHLRGKRRIYVCTAVDKVVFCLRAETGRSAGGDPAKVGSGVGGGASAARGGLYGGGRGHSEARGSLDQPP